MSRTPQTTFEQQNGLSSIIETLGGSEVIQLFIHDVTPITNWLSVWAVIPGLDKYCERALLVARPGDIVCLRGVVDDDYLHFLSSVGIGPRKENIVVVSGDEALNTEIPIAVLLVHDHTTLLEIAKLLKKNKTITINPYIAKPDIFKFATELGKLIGTRINILGGNAEIVDYAEAKHTGREKAIALGVPVSEGEIVNLQLRDDGKPSILSPLKAAIRKYSKITGRVIVKGSQGSSGSSIIIAENTTESIDDCLDKIAQKTDNGVYIVEVMYDVITSPNVLMYIESGKSRISCVSITDQRFHENLVHDGNIYPPKTKTLNDILESARRLTKWLQSEGYTGIVGFDFCEYFEPKRGRIEHFLSDINPRINGAAYPKALMEHLNTLQAQENRPKVEAFLSANVKTGLKSFAELSKHYGHLFYKPENGRGLMPYTIGCLENGKFSVAVFGKSREEVMETYGALEKLTPGLCPS